MPKYIDLDVMLLLYMVSCHGNGPINPSCNITKQILLSINILVISFSLEK